MTTAEEHNLLTPTQKDSPVIVDPMNDNYAVNSHTGEVLMAVRILPDDSPHIIEHRAPTVAEIKSAPILGYGPLKQLTIKHDEELKRGIAE